MQDLCSFLFNLLKGKGLHLTKLIQGKEEWIVSLVKRVEVLLVLFQQLACFHSWFFPLVVWKPTAEQWAHSTAQTEKWPVRANQIFLYTTWTDIFLTACCSVIERVFCLHQKLVSWNLGSYLPAVSFSSHFSSHIFLFASGKALSQWTTALFPTYPESCPVFVRNTHDRLIWKTAFNPAEVFGVFLLLMQVPVTSVGFKIVSEMLNINT